MPVNILPHYNVKLTQNERGGSGRRGPKGREMGKGEQGFGSQTACLCLDQTGGGENAMRLADEGGHEATGNQVQKENATEGDATKDVGSSGKTQGPRKVVGEVVASLESDRLNTLNKQGPEHPGLCGTADR